MPRWLFEAGRRRGLLAAAQRCLGDSAECVGVRKQEAGVDRRGGGERVDGGGEVAEGQVRALEKHEQLLAAMGVRGAPAPDGGKGRARHLQRSAYPGRSAAGQLRGSRFPFGRGSRGKTRERFHEKRELHIAVRDCVPCRAVGMDGPQRERENRREDRAGGDQHPALERGPAGRSDRDAESDEDDRAHRGGSVAEGAHDGREGSYDEKDDDGRPRSLRCGAGDRGERAEDEVTRHGGGAQRIGAPRIDKRSEPSSEGHPEETGTSSQLAEHQGRDGGRRRSQAEGDRGTRRGHLHAGADVPQHGGRLPWNGAVRSWDGRSRKRAGTRAASHDPWRIRWAAEDPLRHAIRRRKDDMRGFLQDLRQALRRLLAAPGFAVVAIVALALGIGANTAIFTVVDAALLRPLPYAAADRLVTIEGVSSEDSRASAVTGADFLDLRGLASVTGVTAMRGHGMNLAGEHPERVSGAVVNSNFFSVLGARMLAGRGFAVADGAAPREAVLGEGLWCTRFGADPAIVGQTLTVNGEPFSVVGVVSADMELPAGSQLWVTPRWKVPDHPLRPQIDNSAERDSAYLDVVARLKPGVVPSNLQAEATALGKRLERDFSSNQGRTFRVTPLRESLYGDLRPTLLLLSAAVAFILLIACANVANLMLARAVSRQHEVAVRQALGAPRWRLVRLFLAESLVLAVCGAALGLVLSLWAAPPLAALSPAYVRPDALHLDGRILAFTAGLALATAFAFGMVPAWQAVAPAEAMRDAGRAGTSGRRRSRLRSGLIVAEVALALVLLIGAGLMMRSFERLSRVDPGFDPSSATAADVWLPQAKYPDSPRQISFYQRLVRALSHAPGVSSAAAVSRLPLSGGNSSRTVNFPDAPDKMVLGDYRLATAGYFETLRIPVRAGRVFTDGEVDSGARVAVVNEAFARAAWPGCDALGNRVLVTSDGKPVEIVGVVGDVKHVSLAVPPRPEIYLPISLETWPFMTLVVRGHGDLSALLRAETMALDPDQPLYRAGTVEGRLASSLGPRRFGAYLLGLLAAVALILAITGIYGVLSYSVAQRTREMGIRLALGATPRTVLALVVGDAFRLVGAGIAIGVGAAL